MSLPSLLPRTSEAHIGPSSEAARGRPILVTGSHRSGTTWTGRMLAASGSPVAVLMEPFGLLHRPGTCQARFQSWFSYLCHENADSFEAPLRDTLSFRYKSGAELRSLRRPKDVARMGRDWYRFHRYQRQDARPLLKDPIAVFSAEWLADTFNMDVVVMIRHPGGFAASLKRLGWTHPFDHFLRQPLLMRDRLWPFEEEIGRFAERERPILEQAALLWKLIYHTVLGYRERRPGWTFVRLEDLARDPVGAFGALYERLGMVFDERARATVLDHSSSNNPGAVQEVHRLKRDSLRAVHAWRLQLTETEKGSSVPVSATSQTRSTARTIGEYPRLGSSTPELNSAPQPQYWEAVASVVTTSEA